MSVAWTQNGSGQYLVESAQHLLQIMNQGALGADTGTPPADYWSASYLQTSDIDLVNDHASILPIGTQFAFDGEYDGGFFHIKNWAHTTTSDSTFYMGLFGRCSGTVLKRIRLSGVWTSSGGSHVGFLCAYAKDSTIYDADGFFTEGTTVGTSSNMNSLGGLMGYISGGSYTGLSVQGNIEFGAECSYVGGVAGYITKDTSFSQCRNTATIPTDLRGVYVGGIVGYVTSGGASLSMLSNSMRGDITGSDCGGVCGYISGSTETASTVDFAINSMTGNITSTGRAGGVIGHNNNHSNKVVHCTKLFNYMHGDITGPIGAGGITGYINVASTGDISFTKSIVAMQGNVDQSVRGFENIVVSQMDVTVDTSFGMTFTGNEYGSATMVVDAELLYDPGFTDLPYFVLSGTDADGNTYSWDFVYANIGGKYPEYTHLSVHTAQVSAPYYTDFGLGDGNTVVYLTYANTDTNTVHHDSSLTIVQTAAATIVQLFTGPIKSDFLFGNVYDITEAGAEVSAAANDLFATGDAVAVNVNGNSTTTTFVNRGGELDITGSSALLLPFDPNVADVQDATFTLSDSTSIDIGFDQPSGQITVDGITYSAGDYFIMDGKKVTVVDI